MQTIFFIGDTHFNHARILEFQPDERPFASIQEHDEILIQNWNKVVKPNDIVWHLGDVVFGTDAGYGESILRRLNGDKRLIMGNHDNLKKIDYTSFFTGVYGFWALKHKIALSHFPLHSQQQYRYKANIHGHLHSHNIDDPWYVNVSCEQINCTPIAWEDLKKKHSVLS